MALAAGAQLPHQAPHDTQGGVLFRADRHGAGEWGPTACACARCSTLRGSPECSVCPRQERNRPTQPPKKPEAAPFFLPTVAGLAGEPTFDVDACAPDAATGKSKKKRKHEASTAGAAPASAAEPTAAVGWGGGEEEGEGDEEEDDVGAAAGVHSNGAAASGSGEDTLPVL